MSDTLKTIAASLSLTLILRLQTTRLKLMGLGIDAMIGGLGWTAHKSSKVEKIVSHKNTKGELIALDVGAIKAIKSWSNYRLFVQDGNGLLVKVAKYKGIEVYTTFNSGLKLTVYGFLHNITPHFDEVPCPWNSLGQATGRCVSVNYGNDNDVRQFDGVVASCGNSKTLVISPDFTGKDVVVLDLDDKASDYGKHCKKGINEELPNGLKGFPAKPAKKARKTVRKVKA